MCRYGMVAYKQHYACFACRKVFKRRLLSDFSGASSEQAAAKCPQCGGLTASMGRDFAAPPQKNEKDWLHLERLFAAGIAFHSCGCSGPGLVPADNEELVTRLRDWRDEYVSNQRFWLNKTAPTTRQELADDRAKHYVEYGKVFSLQGKKGGVVVADAVAYWQARVQDVEQKLSAALARSN